MPPFLRYILGRLCFSLLTLILVTMVLYGVICLAPVDMRVTIYMPKNIPMQILMDAEAYARLKEIIIARNHLDDPFPVQYGTWIRNFFTSDWGWSPTLNEDVLSALLSRLPATLELTALLSVDDHSINVVSGIYAAIKKDGLLDIIIRSASTVASAIPLFIMVFSV